MLKRNRSKMILIFKGVFLLTLILAAVGQCGAWWFSAEGDTCKAPVDQPVSSESCFQKIAHLEQELDDTKRKLQTLINLIETMEPRIKLAYDRSVEANVEAKIRPSGSFESYMCLLLLLVNVLIFASHYIWWRICMSDSLPVQPSGRSTRSGQAKMQTSKIAPRGNLDKSACVIGFYGGSIDNFMELTTSVCESENTRVESCLVQGHDDIGNVPKTRLYFIYIDFNERDVILEDSEWDLRKRVVENLIELGADVFVIYAGDKDSAHLPDNRLYNDRLTSIRQNQLLQVLEERERVLTIYRQFSDTQAEHMKRVVCQMTKSD